MKTSVYVDGLNLYYGCLKGTAFKWLDLVKLSELVLPRRCALDRLLYFTARVSGIVDNGAPARQHPYLSALETFPEVEIHRGRFVARRRWGPITNLPVAERAIGTSDPVTLPAGNLPVAGVVPHTLPVGSYGKHGMQRNGGNRRSEPLKDAVIVQFYQQEEKASDVNLAAHLLNDAWKERFETAVVISNDTDLVTPIHMVVKERNKTVTVVCPRHRGVALELKQVASHVRHIHRSMLGKAQLPNPIPNTDITKPADW